MPSLRSRILHVSLHRINRILEPSISIQEQRTRIDEFARRGIRLPKGVTTRTVEAGGVHSEWIEPIGIDPLKTVIYFHGGGYCICSLDTHRGLAARIALASRSRVLLVDYRLAPENPFPAALKDALSVYRWLLEQGLPPKKIVVGGDSAGGGLTLSTAISLRDHSEPLPAALFLLSPWTDLTFSGETIESRRLVDPIFGRGFGSQFSPAYAGSQDRAHPLISPLFADLHSLPPTYIQVGNDEILLSDSTRLKDRMRTAGTDVQIEIWRNVWHVFQLFAPYIPEAQVAIDRIGAFIQSK